MMHPPEAQAIVDACSYKPGWTIKLHCEGTQTPANMRPKLYVQLSVTPAPGAVSPHGGAPEVPWKSGKRYLSPHMCRQEVVGVIWGLIKDAETHEAAEWFRYKGRCIYNPHLDPDVLAEVAGKATSFNVRHNAMEPE